MNSERNWTRVNIRELEELKADFKRYRLMFRIIFGYLIYDLIIHFDLLS